MKRLVIIFLTVICITAVIFAVSLNNRVIEISGVKLERVEVYKHAEPVEFEQSNVSQLQQQNIIKVL